MVSRCLFISFKVITVMNVYITVEMAAIIAKIETIVVIYSITFLIGRITANVGIKTMFFISII